MSTFAELMAQSEELKRKAEESRKHEVAGQISLIKDLMAKHGITAADLGLGKATKAATPRKVGGQAKYRDPNSGATWTGKGRLPAWALSHKSAGRDLSELAIQ